jgi:hypothetical protein
VEWAITGAVGLEGEAGLDWELLHAHFFYSPDGTTVFLSPTFGAVARLGAFVRWP